MIISIRQRLIFTVLSLVVLASGMTIFLSYRSAKHEVEELFDAQLAQSARVLQTLLLPQIILGELDSISAQQHIQTTFPPSHFADNEEANQYGHAYERKIAFQIWGEANNLIMRSASAPPDALSPSGLLPQHRGYVDEIIEGNRWRVFSVWNNNNTHLVQIGERYDVRDELTMEISIHLLTPAVLSLPLIGILIWIGIGRGLAPVKRVAQEVTRRQPKYLAPMDIGPVPKEIYPLVNELNILFEQLQNAFEKERRFTDDAAHELRTPLAALKTQAQVAMRAHDSEQRQQALTQVIRSVDRATHLIEQMLILARINPQQNKLDLQNTRLYELTAEVIAQVFPKANAKQVNLSLTGTEQARVNVEPISISILIRNIIDNAINYSPQGGTVMVNIEVRQHKVILTVEDNGPGIDPQLQERVFDRFFRILGNNGQGCGLGLSIAKQVADYHNLTIDIKNKPSATAFGNNSITSSGLIVRVKFALPG